MLEPPVAPATSTSPEQFAARCAHDLNNLLTGILGHLELMENRARRNGISGLDSYIEGARHAAGRATAFTQRLLIFSGHAAREPMAVPVNVLIRDLAELLREPDFVITTDLAADAGAAFCDHGQLELALVELLTNAREANIGGGASVRTRGAGDYLEIAVKDGGAGMTPEILARCAEPFFTTRPGGAGKGLGLTLVSKMITSAGGTMSIVCENGTTVILKLPRTV